MEKRVLPILATVMVIALMFGCAAKQPQPAPAPFMAQAFDAGQYDPKVESFMVILDASSSMGMKYNGVEKFDTAKTVVDRLNQTLPELGYTGYLRSFGPDDGSAHRKTTLVYGPAPYDTADFAEGLANVFGPAGTTPIGRAIDDANTDLGEFKEAVGQTAVIAVADGKDPDDNPVASAQDLKGNNPNTCIYTVLVGDDPKGQMLLENMAKAGECGFATTAEAISTPAGMADFVEKVFLSRKPMAPPPPKAEMKPKERHCPDNDNDGICDETDRCPGTPTGAKVGPFGCWVLGEVLFAFDKATIKPEAYPLLDDVHAILAANPNLIVVFEGHTDSVGPEAYNLKLSERRAQAVLDYMLKKGVPSGQIAAVGYGEMQPATSNDTKEGRAINRRVEITPKNQ
jgi:OOP family OmpA-OmpF porin